MSSKIKQNLTIRNRELQIRALELEFSFEKGKIRQGLIHISDCHEARSPESEIMENHLSRTLAQPLSAASFKRLFRHITFGGICLRTSHHLHSRHSWNGVQKLNRLHSRRM